jgi:hypothetical protein
MNRIRHWIRHAHNAIFSSGKSWAVINTDRMPLLPEVPAHSRLLSPSALHLDIREICRKSSVNRLRPVAARAHSGNPIAPFDNWEVSHLTRQGRRFYVHKILERRARG